MISEKEALERIARSPLNSFIRLRTFHGNEEDRNMNLLPGKVYSVNRVRAGHGEKVYAPVSDLEPVGYADAQHE